MSGVLDDMDGITPADIAERWYARLQSPDCSLREREQFDAWLKHSPENLLAFENTKSLWAGLEGLEADDVLGPVSAAALQRDAEPFMGSWAQATEGLGRRTPRPRRRTWFPAAAGIAAAMVGGLFLWSVLTPSSPIVVFSATTKIEDVRLSDGSSIKLDLSTEVDVQLSDARRSIALRQGKAMFNVAKDGHRPFVVDAGIGTVTALGTQFQVERQGEHVAVSLLEGSVGIASVQDASDSRVLRLTPGQQATYTPSTRSWSVNATDVATLTSWSQGFHVFAATPLSQAVAEINRYSSTKLTLQDTKLAKLRVSGSFKIGDARSVAEALPYALPVKISDQAGNIVISKR
jgi:transmembrane sensor